MPSMCLFADVFVVGLCFKLLVTLSYSIDLTLNPRDSNLRPLLSEPLSVTTRLWCNPRVHQWQTPNHWSHYKSTLARFHQLGARYELPKAIQFLLIFFNFFYIKWPSFLKFMPGAELVKSSPCLMKSLALWTRGRVDDSRSEGPRFESEVRPKLFTNPRWM